MIGAYLMVSIHVFVINSQAITIFSWEAPFNVLTIIQFYDPCSEEWKLYKELCPVTRVVVMC